MRVITWNVNGIRARAEQLLELLAAEQPDVVCLQELKASPKQVPSSLGPLALADYWACWHGAAGGYSGVGLLLRRASFAAAPAFCYPAFDMETRAVQAEVLMAPGAGVLEAPVAESAAVDRAASAADVAAVGSRSGPLVVASVYVPNGGKDYPAKLAFLGGLASFAGDLRQRGASVLVCGDMNVAAAEIDVHPSQRDAGTIGQRPDERELLRALFDAGLVDVGRALDPGNQRLFTWWPYWRSARARNLGWRLDYVLASEPLSRAAQESRVRRDFGSSDHAPVVMTFGY